MAIANSKLVGRGPGNSKLRDSLSQAYSDYLYAIIIEEYGILGLLFIPSLYLVWMLIGYREARKQTKSSAATSSRALASSIRCRRW